MGSIRFEGVETSFGPAVKALDKVDLEVADREFVAMVGPSGCGKTTCLRHGGRVRHADRRARCWSTASR